MGDINSVLLDIQTKSGIKLLNVHDMFDTLLESAQTAFDDIISFIVLMKSKNYKAISSASLSKVCLKTVFANLIGIYFCRWLLATVVNVKSHCHSDCLLWFDFKICTENYLLSNELKFYLL